ncbi:hypothetical protein FPSE_09637 [Fusarium pseudograminearum CS3096]|uniref:Peptidase S8/S53 domain-containing protein n=1 Tax=Fusarium pseudograminearum (strain CS3096) TaxID=1028729 RepID=K3UEP4_FUSPC|nr:hypothetical protein FPSE_09637 [Fusarium pseudograminearum CS3096]EKJ70111.1 hypothetical protein FPSE_09637 [Fusarium pseudograminearum CS3096]
MAMEGPSRRLSLIGTSIGSPRIAQQAGLPRSAIFKDAKGPSSDMVFETLKDKWAEGTAVKEKRLGEDTPLKTILDVMIKELKKSKNAIDGVKRFLADEKTKIDDCVKWRLLLDAVDLDLAQKPDKDEVTARLQLTEALIQESPYLAFENPTDQEGASILYINNCADAHWHKKLKDKRTPLHTAARKGNAKFVKSMITEGQRYYDVKNGESTRGENRVSGINQQKYWKFSGEYCRLAKILQHEDLDTKDTPLKSATKADFGVCETIKELLEVTDIAEDDTFHHALENDNQEVVKAFLSKVEVASTIVSKESIMTTLSPPKKRTTGHRDANSRSLARLENAKLLVGSIQDPKALDREVAEKIIKRKSGAMDIWKAHKKEMLNGELEQFLLHLAVKHQKLDFVRLFANDYPKSVVEKWSYSEHGDKRYPLWYNNHNNEGKRIEEPFDDIRKDIRKEITTKMIHEVPEMDTLSDMFNSCQVGELCFDLSRFDSAGFQVSAFINSWISQHQTGKLLTFEKTLRYAEFPPLDVLKEEREIYKDSCHLQYQHTEVFRILAWLRKKMGVQTIIKLKVPDRLVNPHDEKTMAKAVKDFKVEIFDWKVLDLSLSVFDPDAKERIKELHLYSSGKRSAISHWFGPEGFKSMKKLEVLKIYIVQVETCTSTHLWEVKDEIDDKLKELDTPNGLRFSDRAEQISWYPKTQQANLIKIAQRLDPKLGRWLESLNKYYQHSFSNDAFKPTKVAILDDGVLSVSPTARKTAVSLNGENQEDISWDSNDNSKSNTPVGRKSGSATIRSDAELEYNSSLSSRIKEGRSFVAGGSSHSPWHLACNPHGTQMANLICAIDPLCEIYVARVAEDAVGITPDRVTKAIDWAISKGVDIISMSFTIGDKGTLADALIKATKQGIVMTCSSHDEGSKTEMAYPASLKGTDKSLIVLAACDEYGRALWGIEKDDYHYLLPGQNVAAGVIPFLKSNDTISGSSVATAVTAGICSLTLTCDRLANPGRSYNKGMEAGSRYAKVIKELDSMKSKAGSQHILLKKFGEIDTYGLGAGANPGPQEILNRHFR